MPVVQASPFRTDRFLDLLNLSFRGRWNDAWIIRQRLAAFPDLMLDLVEDGFSCRFRFFVMLLRKRPGSFPNFVTGLPHELLFCFGRSERCTDRRPERNTQSG